MRKDTDKTREEQLLEAIGNLPEDMIANAAQYSPWQKNEEEQGDVTSEEKGIVLETSEEELEKNVFPKEEKQKESRSRGNLYFLYRGLTVAACLALVIFAGSTGGKMLRNYLDESAGTSIKSGSVSQYASGNRSEDSDEMKREPFEIEAADGNSAATNTEKAPIKGQGEKENIGEGIADVEMSLWANANWYQEDAKEAENFADENSESKSVSLGGEAFEEGKTISLQISQTTGENGEEIPVFTFGIQGGKAGMKYSLESQISNCKIVSITNEEQNTYINLPDAECKEGDVVEIDTRQIACASWVEGIVPEWEETHILIFDILDIRALEEDGEEKDIGRIVIGEEEGKFYGIYQKPKE